MMWEMGIIKWEKKHVSKWFVCNDQTQSLLMKVMEETKKAVLKLNIQKT